MYPMKALFVMALGCSLAAIAAGQQQHPGDKVTTQQVQQFLQTLRESGSGYQTTSSNGVGAGSDSDESTLVFAQPAPASGATPAMTLQQQPGLGGSKDKESSKDEFNPMWYDLDDIAPAPAPSSGNRELWGEAADDAPAPAPATAAFTSTGTSKSPAGCSTSATGEVEPVVPVNTCNRSTNYDPEFKWVTEAEAWSQGLTAQETAAMKAEPRNLVVYGDSIMQCLHFEMPVCQGAKEVGQRRFGKYNMYSLAVGNEKVTTLMSRLLNGSAPVGLNNDNLTVAMLMVGNNDAGRSSKPGEQAGQEVAENLTELIYWLLEQDPGIQVVPISLLPATGSDFNFAGGQLYEADKLINRQLEYLGEVDDRIHYVDCVDKFLLPTDKTKSNKDLIPDGVHPNAAGFEVIADCVEPTLDKILEKVVKRNGGEFNLAKKRQQLALAPTGSVEAQAPTALLGPNGVVLGTPAAPSAPAGIPAPVSSVAAAGRKLMGQ